MSMFKEAHDELSRIDDGYTKVRNKVDSAFNEMNNFAWLSFDGIALQSRLGDLQAELRSLEGQIPPCKSFIETIHRALPFKPDEMVEITLTWSKIAAKRDGIAQSVSVARDRLAAKNIWANLVGMIDGILTMLEEKLNDLALELNKLTGLVIKNLPWMEG
jgi:hypothetical protein